MDPWNDDEYVERYRVVPAVDVERLRSALRAVVATGGTTLALGPSLLGTLDLDLLPVGMHPFVDPDRRVRPLRDDVVLLAAAPADGWAVLLSGTAERCDHGPVRVGAPPGAQGGVLVLGHLDGPEGAVRHAEAAADPAAADALLPACLASWSVDGAVLGADLYVVPPADRLADLLAPRDR